MQSVPEAIDAIAEPQPRFSAEAAQRTLALDFGLEGKLTPLVSERDQNFKVATADGRCFVFKIASRAEHALTTDLQIKVLLHLENRHCPVTVPVLQRTLSGGESSLMLDGDMRYVCRVVSYVPGVPLSGVKLSAQLAEDFGQSTAKLDVALQDFAHAGDCQILLWDLQRAGELRALLPYLTEPALRASVRHCLDDFDKLVAPALPALRRQVIHADLNPDNVLANSDAGRAIAGVIDFGDMTRAPLIVEVAIASAYLRVAGADVLALIRPFVAGFQKILPLQDDEIGLLFDLVRARLAATITILRWRAATRGSEDAYSNRFLLSESDAEVFLAGIDALGRDAFTEALLAVS